MRRKTTDPAPPSLTSQRAGRLYRLLTLLGGGPQTRPALLRKLKLDVRGFYRDLEALRGFGIEIAPNDDHKYALAGDVDAALAKLPFPDPGLSIHEARQLAANGTTAAHRKLRARLDTFLGGGPNKPR